MKRFASAAFLVVFMTREMKWNHLTQINGVIIYMHKGGKISSQNGKGYITIEVDNMDLPDFGN